MEIRDPETMYTSKQLREKGFRMVDAPLTLLAYDPAGDGDDNDGVIILSREEHRRGELHDPDLAVEIINRVLLAKYMPQDLDFVEKAATLLSLHKAMLGWQRLGKSHDHMLLVEANGVGTAMASFLRTKLGPVRVRGYHTVARIGDKPYDGSGLSMPRLAALDLLKMQMDLRRLKAVKDAPGMKLLEDEFGSFVWKSRNRPEAITGQHDDLIMPLAAANYFGLKVIPFITQQVLVTPKGFSNDRKGANVRLN